MGEGNDGAFLFGGIIVAAGWRLMGSSVVAAVHPG
jgi:hypothetical protein